MKDNNFEEGMPNPQKRTKLPSNRLLITSKEMEKLNVSLIISLSGNDFPSVHSMTTLYQVSVNSCWSHGDGFIYILKRTYKAELYFIES